jgi:DNA-binding GntR family transcriptional regulator
MRFHEVFVEESGSPRLMRMARTFLTETRLFAHLK